MSSHLASPRALQPPQDQAILRLPPSWVNSTPTFFQKWSENSPASSFLPPLLSLGLSSLRNKSVSSQISPGEAWASVRQGADLISQVKQLTLRCEHPQATEGRLEERSPGQCVRGRGAGEGEGHRGGSPRSAGNSQKRLTWLFSRSGSSLPSITFAGVLCPHPFLLKDRKPHPGKSPALPIRKLFPTLCPSHSQPPLKTPPQKGTVTASHQPHTPTYSGND